MDTQTLFDTIISDDQLHAKWLNTLSMMENTGARKISASEHKTKVSLMVLKHAAEEARHAFYLKKQIEKIDGGLCPDYSSPYIICPESSAYYLDKLDIEVCRYLKKELKLTGERLRFGAYLLVTYAIEVRADALYPDYQAALKKHSSKISVKSIILEEETHLAEMTAQMKTFFADHEASAAVAVGMEERLYEGWISSLKDEVLHKNAKIA